MASENCDNIKDIVFKFANPANNSISATALVNILTKVLKGEDGIDVKDQLERLESIERNLEDIKRRGSDNFEKIQNIQGSIDGNPDKNG